MEIWKAIKGYEGYYEVSNFGRVRSVDRQQADSQGKLFNRKGRVLKAAISRVGYHRVVLSINQRAINISIHRLVAIAFLPIDVNRPQVNHKDGNKNNNTVDNLEWCTVTENNRHARKTGLNPPRLGADNPMYGFKSQVALRLKDTETGELKTVNQVAAEYGVTGRHITMMVKGERTNRTKYILQ